jgi:predicted naringenin-chalcone synthase
MVAHPRIIASGTAAPQHCMSQEEVRHEVSELLFGSNWAERLDVAEDVRRVAHLFAASKVDHRQMVVRPLKYYSCPRSTGARMIDYERWSYPLARAALEACLDDSNYGRADAITDFFLVSCTGYSAPGLDILLARDLVMRPDVRRVIIGHMGCFGAIVGLREALATLRTRESALVVVLSIELSSLHYISTMDTGVVSEMALFGDAATAILLSAESEASGPELMDTYCVSDFGAMDQMTWRITDEGFRMDLSRRVPVTLRRNVGAAVEHLLAPRGLALGDIAHWLVHPGGPSILEAIERELKLSRDQMALSWDVLRDHGNCSSATVLLMLDRLLRSGRSKPGEWAVMMAFGPGLTLETCLLRF